MHLKLKNIFLHSRSSQEDLPPTVVPDPWELPHTCLRIGRTLGSGAFGQVVRGRISRSLLMHRGINLHGADGKSGLFVTVAVKMLQGKALSAVIMLQCCLVINILLGDHQLFYAVE